jgi:lauroyl/myristoyl acyltransferase
MSPQWYAHPYNRAELYHLTAAMGWLPRRPRLALACRIGRAARVFLPAERAAARKTLAVMTGASGRRLDELTAEVFGEFAMCFSDLVSASRRPSRLGAYVGAMIGREHLQERDGAVVSLTAHVGNWELAGRLLADHTARTTHVVVAAEEARALERWLRRDGGGLRFVSRTHPTISLTLVAALRRGDAVALQGDRALGTRGDVPVPFFGRPAPFPIGPFHLARAAGVPVVPAFCTLDGDGRYALRVLPPMKVARGGEEDALAAWVRALERLVAEKPTQWFNFFDIWNPFGA